MKCTGKSNGRPCKNWAIKGGSVCHKHGGSAPQVKHGAAMNLLAAKARKLIPDEISIHPDPIRRVLELAAEIDAFRGAVAELVNNLSKLTSWSPETGDQIKAEVMLYERALERASRAYVDICRLNLEERLVQVREAEARALFDALEKALRAADLTDEQRMTVKTSTARHLRAA